MDIENKVVMFADILGFTALIEKYPLDVVGLKLRERILSKDNIYLALKANENKLTDIFSSFHYSLKWALDMANLRHPLTAITFSDSAFVATNYAHEAVSIATYLIHSLLPQKIPMRIGIAYGSFAALRFKSDVTAEGGDHSAQFLGKSVVRAHIAETCGIKGIRILMHPSLKPLLEDPQHNPILKDDKLFSIRYVECSEYELVNKAGITHEINYWNFKPTEEVRAWHGLQNMWDQAPISEVEHFEASAKAINRMRIANGCTPLNKLRRRTLPK
jgi:hypothetical protein